MTLSDHYGRPRQDALDREELEERVKPADTALEAVYDLEGEEGDPAVVSDPEWQAREIADRIEREANRTARGWDLAASSREVLAEEVANLAYEVALGAIKGSPRIEAGDAVRERGSR